MKSKLQSTGTQLLGDEGHDVLAQHQEKCENCRATNQDPPPDPRYFISWVLGISNIRTNLGPHSGVAGGRGCCVIEGQVDRRGIRELFFAQENEKRLFFVRDDQGSHSRWKHTPRHRKACPTRSRSPSIDPFNRCCPSAPGRPRQAAVQHNPRHARTTTAAGSVYVSRTIG